VAALLNWHEVKRLHRLNDAQVQMAREMKLNPKRLLRTGKSVEPPLAQRIETLYFKHFGKSLPDSVVPLRHYLHEARERERAEARERRLRKRQTDRDHLEAMRISMLTLRHMYGGVGANENPGQVADWKSGGET
jgi:hypothetical protein